MQILTVLSGYSKYPIGQLCGSSITSGQVVLVSSFGGGTPVPPTTETATANAFAVGDGVPIWWQSSDAQVLARASAITIASQIPTGNSSSPEAAIPVNTASQTPTGRATAGTAYRPGSSAGVTSPTSSAGSAPSQSNGLPRGAIIGLSVGIPVAVLVGLVIGIFLLRKRRGAPETNRISSFHGPGSVMAILRWMKYVPAKSVGTTTATSEIGSDSRVAQETLPVTYIPHRTVRVNQQPLTILMSEHGELSGSNQQ